MLSGVLSQADKENIKVNTYCTSVEVKSEPPDVSLIYLQIQILKLLNLHTKMAYLK